MISLWRTLNAPLPQYQTLIVRPGDLQQSVLATGKLDALRKVDVGAQVSGQLKTLSVAIGDKVKKISCSALSILSRRKTKSKK
ncbi:macrolide-specific efflux macA domain protein [Shigella flexneri 1235-66]|nr:macrolide-specific efflux macA domain protein [Shigella flexneri 1235-66]